MRSIFITVAFMLVVSAALHFAGCSRDRPQPLNRQTNTDEGDRCKRIVSLAPSITEILFTLDLGDRVIGVTHYCDYPPEARSKKKIGGYADPNLELIVDLRPDLMVMLDLHGAAHSELAKLNIETLSLSADSVSDVLRSIRAVGVTCGVEGRAEGFARSIEERLARIRKKTAGHVRPQVMVSVGRSMGTSSVKDVYVAGAKTYFDEVVDLAGGENVVHSIAVKYPRLSAEGIIYLNPEVIIDLIANIEEKRLNVEDVLREWKSVKQTKAVRTNRVHVLGQDYVVVPGPRAVLLVEQVAMILHPELDWR